MKRNLLALSLFCGRRSVFCGILAASVMGVTHSPAADLNIVFQSDRSGNTDIWRMKADGTGLMQLTTNSAPEWAAIPSPDGRQIAFIREGSGGARELRLINSDGTNDRLVKSFDSSFDLGFQGWTPDGNKLIIYTSPATCQGIPYTIRLDGTAQQLFLNPGVTGDADAWGFSFSSDGSRVVWNSQDGCWSPTTEIFRAPFINGAIQTSQIEQITFNSTGDWNANFSPNDSFLCYSRNVNPNGYGYPVNVFVYGPSGETNITPTFYSATCYDWAPGSKILMSVKETSSSQGSRIYSINGDGSSVTQITTGNASDSEPRWFSVHSDFVREDFSNGLTNWNCWGSPWPVVLSSVQGYSQVFDNNGDPSYNSGANSKAVVSSKTGFVLESDVLVSVSDKSGCWVAANLGLTRSPDAVMNADGDQENDGNGLRLSFWYEGDACWAAPSEYRRHAWFNGHILAEDGTYEDAPSYSINADNYTNNWQHIRIVVQPDRSVYFYVNTNLIWTPTKKLHPAVLAGANVVISGRSSASAGKAYMDNISYSPIVSSLNDNFDAGLTNWTSYGSPRPTVVANIHGRTNAFDNMGDSSYNSGILSKSLVAGQGGFVLAWDSFLEVGNTAGCWLSSSFGLTRKPYPVNGDNADGEDEGKGIQFVMYYAGDACWATPAQYRQHAYFGISLYAEDGTEDSFPGFSVNADAYVNSWQQMRIVVTADRFAKFYIGENLIWTSTKKLHPIVLSGQNLISTGRSSGSAGKSYIDHVSFSQMPSIFTQPVQQSGHLGQSVSFSVDAQGAAPVTYQWLKNGVPISGANDSTYTIDVAQPSDAASYSVVVSNAVGSVTSKAVILSFTDLAMLASLNIMGPVGTTFRIDYSTNLSNGWIEMTNVVLTNSEYLFIDTSSRGKPMRFYRAVPVE